MKFKRVTRRRRVWAVSTTVVAVSATLAACGGGSSGSDDGSETVKVGYYQGILVSLPALVADELGFYADNGLDVELVPVPNGPAMTAGVASGSLDFVNNSYDNLVTAAEKDLPVKAVVGNTSSLPFKLIVRDGVTMPHVEDGYPTVVDDLVDKKWGVVALGVSVQYIDELLLTSSGHARDDVTFLAVGLGDSARAALKNGTIDTYLTTEPLATIAESTGEATVAVDLTAGEGPEELTDLDYNGWWASDRFISSQPDVVEAFVKANEDAYCWYSDPANFDDLVSLLQEAVPVPSLSDEQYRAMVKANLPGFGVDIASSSIDTWNDLLVDNSILSDAQPAEDVLWSGVPSAPTCS